MAKFCFGCAEGRYRRLPGYVRDGGGQYRSIYGDKLKKVTYWTEEDFKTGRVFESDIPLDTRILLDRYEDSDEPSKNHRELFFDIEVEVTDGFPEPTEAPNKITSIAFQTSHDDKSYVYILGDRKDTIKDGTSIKFFKNEMDLLQDKRDQAVKKFIDEIKNKKML